MKLKNIFRHANFFYCLAGALAVCLLLWGSSAPRNITLNTETTLPNINDNWTLRLADTQTPLALVCNYEYAQDGASIARILPESLTTQYLLFYTEHQEVSVFINDVAIYHYETPDGFSFLQTPGNTWHAIALAPEYAGQTIVITFSCPFSRYQVLPDNIFLLFEGELQVAQAYSIWFCNTVALFMIILSVISLVSGSFWKNNVLKQFTCRLGLVYALIALWLFAEINIATLFLGNDITTYLFSMLLIRLMPLSFYYFWQVLSPKQTRWSKWIERLFAANLFLPFVLQLAFGISLLDTLQYNYLLALISVVIMLAHMAVQAWHLLVTRQKISLYQLLYFAGTLLLFGVLGEIYCFANYATLGTWRGTAISMATILYTISTRIILVRIETEFERETEALAQKNNKLQLMPLMQQINAHFLFNTLNNISFLCKRDPKAADESVLLLAQYMREYMFLINTSDLIPFSREQSLMDAYLSIQQIRFEEKLSFSIDANAPDFYLPPLCIQPFVENAILHGIRNKPEGGNVTIAYAQEDEFIKITVQDNGVGFDTAILQQSERVGIQNVQKRLALYGGWLAIASTPNGTTVDVYIPEAIQPI